MKKQNRRRGLRRKKKINDLIADRNRELKKKFRFLIAGGLNTLVGLGMFPLLFIALEKYNLHYTIILAISQIFCITFSYSTNKIIVFKTKGNYMKEYVRFILFHGVYFVVNLVALPAMVEIGRMSPMVSQLIFSVIVIVTSYAWHSRITFKS